MDDPQRPLRGLARSHRDRAALRINAVPVGAGLPAKGP
ncbi:triphosphoribosyl-dephospho-CoA synthase MdcB, partial [Salmonella enterica subsp. enterica serovar Enteritidis]|nr:triphosphoribosyl-dephospho-CoA synthase MdcB [Salmonella enterica subsp. enterica serovar Enteritidis]